MNISPNNEKIQKYLDELSEEYKELLFRALLERSKSIDDISISELLRLDNEIKKPLIENYQRRILMIAFFAIVFGIIYLDQLTKWLAIIFLKGNESAIFINGILNAVLKEKNNKE